MLDAPDEPSAGDIGLRTKLHDKGAMGREGPRGAGLLGHRCSFLGSAAHYCNNCEEHTRTLWAKSFSRSSKALQKIFNCSTVLQQIFNCSSTGVYGRVWRSTGTRRVGCPWRMWWQCWPRATYASGRWKTDSR